MTASTLVKNKQPTLSDQMFRRRPLFHKQHVVTAVQFSMQGEAACSPHRFIVIINVGVRVGPQLDCYVVYNQF
jgi:hypothetical protein